jgi:hypothetical protein
MADGNRNAGHSHRSNNAPNKLTLPDLQGFEFTFESSTLRFEVDVRTPNHTDFAAGYSY